MFLIDLLVQAILYDGQHFLKRICVLLWTKLCRDHDKEILCRIGIKIRTQIHRYCHTNRPPTRHSMQKLCVYTPHKYRHKVFIQRRMIPMCDLFELLYRHPSMHQAKLACRQPVFMNQICFFLIKSTRSAFFIISDKAILTT